MFEERGVSGEGATRALTDLFRRNARRSPPEAGQRLGEGDPVYTTKALSSFLTRLTMRQAPILVELGPVDDANVKFFGGQHGCKIFVEDVYADLDRFTRQDDLDALPAFLETRFGQADASVDGVLCWDLIDYLDRPAAAALASQIARLLRPGGVVLGFFSTLESRSPHYTKYEVVDECRLRHRRYAAAQARGPVLLNREIIRLFEMLGVSDSFLLHNNTREILFQKPSCQEPDDQT